MVHLFGFPAGPLLCSFMLLYIVVYLESCDIEGTITIPLLPCLFSLDGQQKVNNLPLVLVFIYDAIGPCFAQTNWY